MSEPSYLGIFFLATAGQNGSNLGSDEEEIILLVLSILDKSTNEVLSTSSLVVCPSDVNENLLSEECKAFIKLSDDQVKNAKPLDHVIEQLDKIVETHTGGSKITLIVDGQCPLRQCLHPEASAKDIPLPQYFYDFFDLRKEFETKYGHKPEDIEEMIQHLGIEVSDQDVKSDGEIEILGKIREMELIVKKMIADEHTFSNLEVINQKLEPGICSKEEEVDNNCVVRARGLPWQSSDSDIAKFFRGLNISKGGVALCLSPQGRRNGEALIRFESQEHRDMAIKRHKHHIATRYIEVYRATGEDFINVAGGSNNEAQAFLSKGGQVIVRMRGLPYDCTVKQVLEFFDSGETPCQVLEGDEGVLFVKRPDGRATGDAFVLFALEEDASKALSKHRESIGSRYIELFRSTTAEVQQVLNRCLEPKSAELSPQLPLIPPATPVTSNQMSPVLPILPQHVITSGTRKDCIRLRGLPYEAQVEHILEFLGEYAKNIVYQGVHMVYNAQGQPSGEAFIQMDSEQSAYLSAQSKHHRYMMYFKKQRYIEVFQCSGDDMNMVLTGGLPQKALVSPPGGLLAPGPGYTYAPYSQAPIIPRTAPSPYGYPQIFYWPYPSPSPPVSPTTYYGTQVPVTTPTLIPQDFGALSLNGGHPKQPPHTHHSLVNGHVHPNGIGPQVTTPGGELSNGFRNELGLGDKGRPLLPTKNYMELGLFMA